MFEFAEASAIFETAWKLRDERAWRKAREAVCAVSGRERNVKTIRPFLTIAVRLTEKASTGEEIDLSNEAVGELCDVARYAVTPEAVRRLVGWFKQWLEERDKISEAGKRLSGSYDSMYLKMEKYEKARAHYEDIRSLTRELIRVLPFGEPHVLSYLDISRGAYVDPFGGLPDLHWEDGDSHTLRTLDDKFGLLKEHLERSDQTGVQQELQKWQELGGCCLTKCKLLLQQIRSGAERATGMDTRFSDSSGPVRQGLWDGFWRSLYVLALSHPKDLTYSLVSQSGDLSLLALKGKFMEKSPPLEELFELDWNVDLAWVSSYQVASVKAIHKQLRQQFRQSPLVPQIGAFVAEMKKVDRKLADLLSQFSSQSPIPGRCGQCPD